MKKIISLILMLACVLTCAFALASCGGDENPPAPEPAYSEAAAAFITAYNAANVTNYVTSIEVTTELGALNSMYIFVKNPDGTSTISYMFEKINGLDAEDEREIVNGAVTSDKNGNFAEDPHGVAAKLGATGIKLDIDNTAITDFTVADAYTLSITVKKDSTAAILGAALPSDAVVVVQLAGTSLKSVSLDYTDENGNAVKMISNVNVDLGASND